MKSYKDVDKLNTHLVITLRGTSPGVVGPSWQLNALVCLKHLDQLLIILLAIVISKHLKN